MSNKNNQTLNNKGVPEKDTFNKKRARSGALIPHKSKKESLGPNTDR